MCFSLSLVVGTTTLQNMKRCMCANTHTLTSDAHTFVIYCLFRIPHTASSPRFPACCLPVHAFLLWPVAYSLLPMACGLLYLQPHEAYGISSMIRCDMCLTCCLLSIPNSLHQGILLILLPTLSLATMPNLLPALLPHPVPIA